jgi:hypothetical protein
VCWEQGSQSLPPLCRLGMRLIFPINAIWILQFAHSSLVLRPTEKPINVVQSSKASPLSLSYSFKLMCI